MRPVCVISCSVYFYYRQTAKLFCHVKTAVSNQLHLSGFTALHTFSFTSRRIKLVNSRSGCRQLFSFKIICANGKDHHPKLFISISARDYHLYLLTCLKIHLLKITCTIKDLVIILFDISPFD